MSGGQSYLADLFRQEAEVQVGIMNSGLLALERAPHDLAEIEPLMRAAHSLKGAARVVALDAVVQLAHQMEECFVAVQNGRLRLSRENVDALLAGVDLIGRIALLDEAAAHSWAEQNTLVFADVMVRLYDLAEAARAAPASVETASVETASVETASQIRLRLNLQLSPRIRPRRKANPLPSPIRHRQPAPPRRVRTRSCA